MLQFKTTDLINILHWCKLRVSPFSSMELETFWSLVCTSMSGVIIQRAREKIKPAFVSLLPV